ncbi:MAG: Crp/Fnr family transcriptional regulator [Acidobacteriia bacterium]|nr:Crp/Fnr family transcriptional regulator [Terriglobia bacterium]
MGWNTVDAKSDKFVFTQGDVANSVYYLREGRVKLSAVSTQGKEAIVGLCDAHHFFGEGCLAGQERRLSTATTLTDCKAIRFERDFMRRLIAEEPRFSALFLSHLVQHVSRMEEDLLDQLFNSTEKRLARALVRISNAPGSTAAPTAGPKVNQEMLAAMIGATRTRVNFFMNRFREQGYIDYGEKLIVNHSLVNELLAD